jgi:hypothetical protein
MTTKEIQVHSTARKPYGHIPGHHYHDVDVWTQRKANGRWFVIVLETWGNCQGHDEEHGQRQICGRGNSLAAAEAQAEQLAKTADINREYLAQALSQAASEAEEQSD